MNPHFLDRARRALAEDGCPEKLREFLLDVLIAGKSRRSFHGYECQHHPEYRRWAGAIHWACESSRVFESVERGWPSRYRYPEKYLRYLSKHLKRALDHEP